MIPDLSSLSSAQRERIARLLAAIVRNGRALVVRAEGACEAVNFGHHHAPQDLDLLGNECKRLYESWLAIGYTINESEPENEADLAELTRGQKSAF